MSRRLYPTDVTTEMLAAVGVSLFRETAIHLLSF